MDGIHFWGDEWNGKSVLEARSLFENGMIQAEIQRKRESDFQYSNREIANNEPPTLLREKRSGAGGFAVPAVGVEFQPDFHQQCGGAGGGGI